MEVRREIACPRALFPKLEVVRHIWNTGVPGILGQCWATWQRDPDGETRAACVHLTYILKD